jgi:uncharacterized repeat protein (TIGR01451 family)
MKMRAKVAISLACCLICWAGPASARLYPPCQSISQPVLETNGSVDSITYSIADPISGQTMSETWTEESGADERRIESVQIAEGILTWISKYKYSEDYDYTFGVHLRIYDPGRGRWMADHWTLYSAYNFVGFHKSIGQHQVQDGVVAWTAHRKLADGRLEHKVVTATYDPKLGSWVWNETVWQVPWNSLASPEVLRVKNGVVAWAMKNFQGECSDGCSVPVYMTIYDYEVHQWVGHDYVAGNCSWGEFPCYAAFDWVEIYHDLPCVHVQFWHLCRHLHEFFSYDPYLHRWTYDPWTYDPWSFDYQWHDPIPIRRAFFVAQPESVIVPQRVWFWDCSTGLDGTAVPSNWLWSINNGQYWNDGERSPSYNFTIPGPYIVAENIHNPAYINLYTSWVGISANTPPLPPGGIGINNNAAYTTSSNVTLSLNYGSTATQMCFRESPGLFLWGSWEPVAHGKAWTLSTSHPIGGTPDGPKTVYVKYRDQYGTESTTSEDSITLVTTPPTGALSLNNGDATTYSPTVTAAWSATSNYAMEMSYCAYNQEDTRYHWSAWETYQPTTKAFAFSSTLGKKKVMVRFKDVAGNIAQVEAAIDLIAPDEADLALTMTDSPDPVSAGSSLTYTMHVTNLGPDDAASVVLKGSLPPGVTFVSATASQGGCRAYPGAVRCGLGDIAGERSATVTVVVIPSAVGTINHTAYVDSGTMDPDPGNNAAGESTLVDGALTPDLVVSALSDPPVGTLPGWTFPVTDTVTNQGSSGAGASTTMYYFSLDTIGSAGDIPLEGSRAVGTLVAGESSEGSTNYTIPASTPAGSYYLLACADDLEAVSESVEINNCAASAGKAQVAGGLPDLVESAVSSSPSAVFPGETLDVTDTVMNQGGGMAGSSTSSYYLSVDTTRGSGDVPLGTRSIGALLPMGGIQGTVAVTVPVFTTPGYYYLLACADDPGSVSESDEANNCRASAGKVQVPDGLPDLMETSISIPMSAAFPGGALEVTDTMVNYGTGMAGSSTTRYYLSLDTTKSSGDVLIGSRSVGALLPTGGLQGTVSVTVPAYTAAGTYYVLACADDLGAVLESDETNNCLAYTVSVIHKKVLLPFLPLLLE